ncbi:MAG: aspartate kinase [Candidatus Obscuribacterales bacterium]|nr:aspartate kinase [Candidatus Obscuribacterales bacterium]
MLIWRDLKSVMSEFQVLKFGGTSVKTIARIQHVAEIIKGISSGKKVLAVVSAMGDTTDFLVKLAKQASEVPDRRELDMLLSTGEQISIALLCMVLKDMGVAAKSLTANQVGIFTETVHTRARILDINSKRLFQGFESSDVLVVAGFQGVTVDGDITTLGRGGSDTTAVALAAAINAAECDIYTDVDGIFTSDPNKIPGARLLPRVSYGEVLEMARLGAQVLHPRAVELARQYNVKLRVRNTFKPEHQGTTIDAGGDMEIFRSISGVAVDEDQCSVAIMDVPDQPGIAGKVAQALADQNIAVDMIMQSFHPTAGSNSITFTVHDADLDQTIKILAKLKSELNARDVLADPDCAKVSLIGAGLCGQPWIPALLFSTLGKNKINIKMISSSEMKITCVVSRKQAQEAARLVHDAFELKDSAKPAS